MEKRKLRQGLKRLEEYLKGMGVSSIFLEENKELPMDSLMIPLKIGQELSIDITRNFVEVPDMGSILQFYGQLVIGEMMEEEPKAMAKERVLCLIDALNHMLPVGQMLFMDEGENDKRIGIRYTMLTDLDCEKEWEKCVYVLRMLMQAYELLCSSLLLFMDGSPVEEVMQAIGALMEED